MNKTTIILLILVVVVKVCAGYDYPKPECKFDVEDIAPNPSKRRAVRGVFFYTYDDNIDDREVEMHELSIQAFKKLISSSEYVKSPAALKSSYDLVSFFDGRCQTSINCERFPQKCPVTIKPTTTEPPRTLNPWPSNTELQEITARIYYNYAPYLAESQLDEILTSLKNTNEFTKYWSASQIHEIGTRNSFIVQDHLEKQNTSGIYSVMKFSDETKQHMINYTKEIIPSLSMDEILEVISNAEDIGTAHMRYLTLNQYKELRAQLVAAFADFAKNHGFISTTKEPPTTSTIAVEPWPSNNEIQERSLSIYYDFAPHLTQSQLDEILNSLKHMNEYTKYWTASQVDEISTRNSLIVQDHLQKQNTSGINSVMRFSNETKQHMINYTREINPGLSLDEILGMISIVEEIGTAHMRYVTLDQYKKLRGEVVAVFANNTEIHGFVSTTKAPTTTMTTTTTKNTTTIKPVPTKATEPWPSNNELQKISESIYYDFAPHLTESQLNEILTSLKNMNEYTKYWTAYQVNEISTRNSLIVQEYLQKQKNPGINSVMRFSDETKQHMIKYTQEINPNLSLDEILGMISIVEEIGTAHMRYVTLDQYKKLRGEVVAAFADNTEIHGFVSTSKAPTTSTTTKKPATTTKTYIPPAKSIRKPYTRWAGQTYRQFTGQYSFGYTWKPFTGGYSWRTRHYTDGSTTTTERYRQRSFANEFNPVEN